MGDEDLDLLFIDDLEPAAKYGELEDPEVCCNCGSREGVKMEPSYTQYETPTPTRYDHVLEELPLDPNRDRPYCRPCAEDHKAFWDEMWKEYYSSR